VQEFIPATPREAQPQQGCAGEGERDFRLARRVRLDNGIRQLLILPRVGASENHMMMFENGRLHKTSNEELAQQQKAKQAEAKTEIERILAYIAMRYKRNERF
jgi:hypothetical protein